MLGLTFDPMLGPGMDLSTAFSLERSGPALEMSLGPTQTQKKATQLYLEGQFPVCQHIWTFLFDLIHSSGLPAIESQNRTIIKNIILEFIKKVFIFYFLE